jgi:hypothetical protein
MDRRALISRQRQGWRRRSGRAPAIAWITGDWRVSMRRIVADLVLQRLAMRHAVQHAMIQQIFGALEALGQLFADRLFDHARPGKQISAFGSAICTSPSIA